MILSFAWTWDQYLSGKKTCTRRPKWSQKTMFKWQRAWDEGRLRHQAWNHIPFVKGAERGPDFDMTCRPYWERLCDMPVADLEAEGGLWATVDEFIALQGVHPETLTPVLRFEKVEE